MDSKIQLYGASVSNFHLRFYACVPLFSSEEGDTHHQSSNQLTPRYCLYERYLQFYGLYPEWKTFPTWGYL